MTKRKGASPRDRRLADEAVWLMQQGETDVSAIADRLQVSKGTLQNALSRCRLAGDDRIPEVRPREDWSKGIGAVIIAGENSPEELAAVERLIHRRATGPEDAAELMAMILGRTEVREGAA